MGIQVPGKRYGKRLAHSKIFGHGAVHKKTMFADLLITPLVDMFVIIVLFLIANFSATGEILNQSKDIQLPEAANVDELQMDPVVMVSMDYIFFDGAMVGKVDDLTREDYLNIQSLEERLREAKKKTEDLHSLAKDADGFKGNINIQAHKEVKFSVIKRVMFTCATAGFGNINFAVMNSGSGEPGVPKAAPAVR